ncbi:MAG: hypothetical protein QME74_07260 [Candidatus Edwardsbacteria bacterium]|nr:hypothetical protein [Candidatus Edwardsbacteria bacterium]
MTQIFSGCDDDRIVKPKEIGVIPNPDKGPIVTSRFDGSKN